MKLVKWAWSHLYLVSVDTGLVLPLEFYTDLSTMPWYIVVTLF